MNEIISSPWLYQVISHYVPNIMGLQSAVFTITVVCALVFIGWLLSKLLHRILSRLFTALSTVTPPVLKYALGHQKLIILLVRIVVLGLLIVLSNPTFIHFEWLYLALNKALNIILYVMVLQLVNLLLDLVKHEFDRSQMAKQLSIDAFVQVGKLVNLVVFAILFISLLLGQSPLYIMSGIGALTAVLLLVFKDTLLGLMAGFQLAANKMIRNGDWIELPQYGADGTVKEVGLTSVKIQNFDNTISTVPTYELVNKPVKNWRGMEESQGRRIKRSLMIDLNTVGFLTAQDISQLQQLTPLQDYARDKLIQLASSNAELNDQDINQRRLTNLGTFRAYMSHYLSNHPQINQHMTLMVRQLAPTEHGIPLQVYCFCTDKRWVAYEGIQSDIFDHFISMLPFFNLRAFQHLSQLDTSQITRNSDASH